MAILFVLIIPALNPMFCTYYCSPCHTAIGLLSCRLRNGALSRLPVQTQTHTLRMHTGHLVYVRLRPLTSSNAACQTSADRLNTLTSCHIFMTQPHKFNQACYHTTCNVDITPVYKLRKWCYRIINSVQ